jgi:serine/threonine-protein kinase
MGKVYLGRARVDGDVHTVAIKVLHPHLAQDSEMVAMFLDEARVSMRLRHPNVVKVWDIDLLGEELVIVMDYVEGAPLSSLLHAAKESGELLSVATTVRIVVDALTGLHAAHEIVDENGRALALVHRDVSPHNLLVGADGVTRVSDFGVALSAGRLASTRPDGGLKGKLRYLAPEQINRKVLDRRVDVFAAGIVLWECLTGKRLFDGGTEAETVTQVMREPIAPPSLSRPEVLTDLDEVCLRALERDPNRRFATADEFAEALRRAVPAIATPAEVGEVVTEAARESIYRRREALERTGKDLAPPADEPSQAAVAIPIRAARPAKLLALVALLSILLGVAVTKLALRPQEGATSLPPSSSAATAAAPVGTTSAADPDPKPAAATATPPFAAVLVPASAATSAKQHATTPPRSPTVADRPTHTVPAKGNRPFMPGDL